MNRGAGLTGHTGMFEADNFPRSNDGARRARVRIDTAPRDDVERGD